MKELQIWEPNVVVRRSQLRITKLDEGGRIKEERILNYEFQIGDKNKELRIWET